MGELSYSIAICLCFANSLVRTPHCVNPHFPWFWAWSRSRGNSETAQLDPPVSWAAASVHRQHARPATFAATSHQGEVFSPASGNRNSRLWTWLDFSRQWDRFFAFHPLALSSLPGPLQGNWQFQADHLGSLMALSTTSQMLSHFLCLSEEPIWQLRTNEWGLICPPRLHQKSSLTSGPNLALQASSDDPYNDFWE